MRQTKIAPLRFISYTVVLFMVNLGEEINVCKKGQFKVKIKDENQCQIKFQDSQLVFRVRILDKDLG